MRHTFKIDRIENCTVCRAPESKIFCGLSGRQLESFEALTQINFFPKGAVIFLEQDSPRGVHIVCSGKVKLSTTNDEGKRVILSLAGPGDTLGARDVLMDRRYDFTAETLEPSQLRYLRKEEFLRFLSTQGDICLRVARELGRELYLAYERMRGLALRTPSTERMVRLLLTLATAYGQPTTKGILLGIELSREEFGQMIGASRETASRILAALERKRIIRSKGGNITILDMARLRGLEAGG